MVFQGMSEPAARTVNCPGVPVLPQPVLSPSAAPDPRPQTPREGGCQAPR